MCSSCARAKAKEELLRAGALALKAELLALQALEARSKDDDSCALEGMRQKLRSDILQFYAAAHLMSLDGSLRSPQGAERASAE